MAKSTSVEKCFEIIESSVEALESDDLSLDDALGKYEEGLKYLRQAKKQLDAYEARLETLSADSADADTERADEKAENA